MFQLPKTLGNSYNNGTVSFQRLELGIRHLRYLLVLMVAIIALLPTTIFLSLEYSHQQERTHLYGRQIALLVSRYLARPERTLARLAPHLEVEMAANQILFLRLVGMKNEELLRLGRPQRQVVALRARVPLFPTTPPVKAVEIQRDGNLLLREASRVFGIHLGVATVLAVLICVLPLQAMRRAVDDVKAAQAQVLHSHKLSALGEVFAGLTHEINSPLSIMLSRVKLLLYSAREQGLPAEVIQDLEVIERHGTRIAEILQGLLTFARKTPLEFVLTDLNRVIKDAVTLVEKPFMKEGVRITTDLDPDLPAIWGSPSHLQQVFLNLLNNARDAMPQGGEITIRTFPTPDHVVAEVQDTGTGIASEIRERIFDPFFTTKEAGKGTGLGLSVSYGILLNHGGRIAVESTPGAGTTFRLALPLGERRGHEVEALQGAHRG